MQQPRPYSDTDPAAMAVWLDLLRRKSDGEKLEALFDLIGFAWDIAEIGVRSRYPTPAIGKSSCALRLCTGAGTK
jgi:hypothetical protein